MKSWSIVPVSIDENQKNIIKFTLCVVDSDNGVSTPVEMDRTLSGAVTSGYQPGDYCPGQIQEIGFHSEHHREDRSRTEGHISSAVCSQVGPIQTPQ